MINNALEIIRDMSSYERGTICAAASEVAGSPSCRSPIPNQQFLLLFFSSEYGSGSITLPCV